MKKLITLAFMALAMTAQAQTEKEYTSFVIDFPKYVQVVYLADTSLFIFAKGKTIIDVGQDSEPAHFIVCTERTRRKGTQDTQRNLILIPSDRKKVLATWKGNDLVLE